MPNLAQRLDWIRDEVATIVLSAGLLSRLSSEERERVTALHAELETVLADLTEAIR